MDIRALAEFLGHADPGFTLRTYTHLMPPSRDRCARRSTTRGERFRGRVPWMCPLGRSRDLRPWSERDAARRPRCGRGRSGWRLRRRGSPSCASRGCGGRRCAGAR
ncbi:hypothetical protein [Actinomadura nitritigenes]|uniref:hypothetical protein n=1 Tax=Actinomadura nitritigenes TaxID=134602 RepID=UPI003D8DDC02